ncbi:dockerin type I domain-containing protein [Clostridium sp. LP20]|uniref:dockerin type I domain-containing protein n=1 Tax=Clostridium sp. LP20 TaxID=3418665 RepID=UPI003EE64292
MIENTSSIKVSVTNSTTYNSGRYNLSIYDSEGKLIRKYTDNYGDFALAKGQRAEITLATPLPVKFYIPSEIVSDSHELEDVNKDGLVNILDIAMVSNAYNTMTGEKGFLSNCDLNKDGIIDIFDIVKVSSKVTS